MKVFFGNLTLNESYTNENEIFGVANNNGQNEITVGDIYVNKIELAWPISRNSLNSSIKRGKREREPTKLERISEKFVEIVSKRHI